MKSLKMAIAHLIEKLLSWGKYSQNARKIESRKGAEAQRKGLYRSQEGKDAEE